MKNLTLFLLLTACGPTSEDIFAQEAAEASCSCYATDAENVQCIADLESSPWRPRAPHVSSSGTFRSDKQVIPW